MANSVLAHDEQHLGIASNYMEQVHNNRHSNSTTTTNTIDEPNTDIESHVAEHDDADDDGGDDHVVADSFDVAACVTGERITNFNANILKQSVTSVTINWNLIEHADVYKIEKYHRKRGWEQVAWTGELVATIDGLEENFGYRLRIIAMQYSAELKAYKAIKTSTEVMVTTMSAPPSTICLQRAIKKGQRFLVKSILRRRPSLIEYPGPNGYLPLPNAIAYSDMSIIDVLLTAGASVHNGNPTNGRTPLHVAFFYGQLAVARILLNKNGTLHRRDAMGLTACHMAIDGNQYEILKFAIESGADLELKDECGWTLLLRAVVMRADVTILKLLVMNGADLYAKDLLDKNCIDLARLYRNFEATKYFTNVIKLRKKKQEQQQLALELKMQADQLELQKQQDEKVVIENC